MAKQSEMAAAWAAQTGKTRKAASASYEGDTLKSYGVGIARIIQRAEGTVALVTSLKYSTSTSATTGIAEKAAREAGHIVFVVPDIYADRPVRGGAVDNHEANHAHLIAAAREASAMSQKARTTEAANWRLRQSDDLYEQAKRYAFLFMGPRRGV